MFISHEQENIGNPGVYVTLRMHFRPTQITHIVGLTLEGGMNFPAGYRMKNHVVGLNN